MEKRTKMPEKGLEKRTNGGRIPLTPAPASSSNAKFTEPAEVKVVEVARPASLGRVFRAPPRAGTPRNAPLGESYE